MTLPAETLAALRAGLAAVDLALEELDEALDGAVALAAALEVVARHLEAGGPAPAGELDPAAG